MRRSWILSIVLALVACGQTDDGQAADDAASDETGAAGTTTEGGSTGGDDGGPQDPFPTEVCDRPIEPVDVSAPDAVIGDGTAAGCTEAALRQAVSAGGVIVFDCGPDPVTIDITQTLELRTDVDTTIDGGDLVTLDGGKAVRIFNYFSPDFRVTTTLVTLQRLTVQNAKAPATDFTPEPATGDCAWGFKDGEGGALHMRDGRLHVIDSVFRQNEGASPGPDTGGGAFYIVASLDVTVVGSRFEGNTGSNGGAIALLQSTGRFYNTTFVDNAATGKGMNFVAPGCPEFNHAEQGGAGGNGGAVHVDGVEETELMMCGVVLRGNTAGELGGGVFRTPNRGRQQSTFLGCTIEGNTAGNGGGGLYISNSWFTLHASAVIDNVAIDGPGAGARTELGSHADIANVTFSGNVANTALGGGLWHAGTGSVVNCTFADNRAVGGAGFYGSAIGGGNQAEVRNTVFSGNSVEDPAAPMSCWDEPAPGGNAVQWPRAGADGSDDTACVEDVVWADPELGELGNHGGPTPSILVSETSPAVDLGRDCPATDQRGRPRDRDRCTAGATEG